MTSTSVHFRYDQHKKHFYIFRGTTTVFKNEIQLVPVKKCPCGVKPTCRDLSPYSAKWHNAIGLGVSSLAYLSNASLSVALCIQALFYNNLPTTLFSHRFSVLHALGVHTPVSGVVINNYKNPVCLPTTENRVLESCVKITCTLSTEMILKKSNIVLL